MKKLMALIAGVVLLAGGCCCNECKAEDLINYVPADVDGVLSVDAARMIKLSQLQDLRKEDKQFEQGWVKFEEELAKYGLKPDDLPSRVMVFFKSDGNTQNAGILALTKITEDKFLELIGKSKNISCTPKTIGGRKAYVIAQKEVPDNTAVVCYIKPDLALVCDDDKAEDLCREVGKGKNSRLIAADKKADHDALMYLLYSREKDKSGVNDQNAAASQINANFLDSLEAAVITMNLCGQNQKDISLKADIDCCDAQNAAQITVQMKTMLMIMTMQMAQNPELGKAVTEAVAINQKDKNIKVDVAISEKLLEKIKTHVQEQKKQNEMAVNPAAPAAAPQCEAGCQCSDAASEKPAKASSDKAVSTAKTE
ncbi:MAG: hypothetical protein PHV59_07215 [Victivallales bacterium]|nr:hypothetical protein [Victivallales bacterium]